MNKKMTSKEMVYAAFEGRKLEHFPVASPYTFLAIIDHWTELTGLPLWKYYEWLISEPEERKEIHKLFVEKLPFDILDFGYHSYSADERRNMEVVLKDGKAYYHYKKENKYEKLSENTHESGSAGGPVETRIVFDKADAREKVKVEKAESSIARGCNEYKEKAVRLFGDEKFIYSGAVVNTFYMCSHYVGMINLFSLLYDDSDLIEYLSERILEQNIETIRTMAAAGGDAIWIDDATSTKDMISTAMYEKYSLPYLRQQVKEIQRLGKKAVLIYFGGIADRVEQIVSTGADALLMETSMKGYVNDFEATARQINGRMCLFGNIDPVGVLEFGSDQLLYDTIAEQVRIGRQYGRYVTSTGSPITPKTSVSRMRRFIDIAHEL